MCTGWWLICCEFVIPAHNKNVNALDLNVIPGNRINEGGSMVIKCSFSFWKGHHVEFVERDKRFENITSREYSNVAGDGRASSQQTPGHIVVLRKCV